MEQRSVVLFLRVKGLLKKAIHHELVAVLQENAVSNSTVARFCRDSIWGQNLEEASSSPKDDGFDEVNEAILLALFDELFLLYGRAPAEDMFQRYYRSSACRFSTFHSQTSRIFSGLLTSSPKVRRQVGSNRVVDPTWRPPVVHPASRMGRYLNP
jgi:hypothetical protein